jgi:glutaredoxin-like protein NrdH
MTTTVYAKSNCQPCAATKKFLDDNAIPYILRNIETDEGAIDEAITYGFRAMPIVVSERGNWAGYNADKLASLLR